MQVETVQLSRQAGALKEVVVTSQRPMIEQLDHKIVFNVGDDPTAKSETAIEISRLPGVFLPHDCTDFIKLSKRPRDNKKLTQ